MRSVLKFMWGSLLLATVSAFVTMIVFIFGDDGMLVDLAMIATLTFILTTMVFGFTDTAIYYWLQRSVSDPV